MKQHTTKSFPDNFQIDILEKNVSIKDYIKTKISENLQQLNSFFVIDMTHLAKKLDQWKKNLPYIELFYAVKCNDEEAIIKFLAEAGCGFDCASKQEMDLVRNYCGVKTNEIIFSHPCKQIEHLIHAKNQDIIVTTFDSVEELDKIKQHHPKAEVVLRIKTHDELSKIRLSKIFGAAEEEWETLIAKCVELDLNLTGVSFHVGTGCYDTLTFARAIEDSAKVFKLAAGYGLKLKLLNIGGGFPGSDCSEPTFEQFAETINESIKLHFSEFENVRMIAEPGRYFAEGCVYFVSKILSRKIWDEKELSEEEQELQKIFKIEELFAKLQIEKRPTKPKYYINESTTLSFSNAIYEEANYVPKLLEDHKDEKTFESEIYGNSDCIDELIASEVELPILNLNEYVYFENMGAYTTSIADGMSYNGLKMSENVFICWTKDFESNNCDYKECLKKL